MKKEMFKLKPCPFCGAEVREAHRGVNNSRMFECTNRSCGGVMNFVSRKGEQTPREKYNRRATEIKEKKEQEAKGERLVDANALIEGRVENDPVRIAAMCAPTAFDKEKVIEELNDTKDIPHDDSVAEITSTRIWNKAITKSIKIIERGGID